MVTPPLRQRQRVKRCAVLRPSAVATYSGSIALWQFIMVISPLGYGAPINIANWPVHCTPNDGGQRDAQWNWAKAPAVLETPLANWVCLKVGTKRSHCWWCIWSSSSHQYSQFGVSHCFRQTRLIVWSSILFYPIPHSGRRWRVNSKIPTSLNYSNLISFDLIYKLWPCESWILWRIVHALPHMGMCNRQLGPPEDLVWWIEVLFGSKV